MKEKVLATLKEHKDVAILFALPVVGLALASTLMAWKWYRKTHRHHQELAAAREAAKFQH